MSAPISSRRGFLHGLASLPLIGGSVALIGQPTAAAVPVTDTILHSYKNWLHYEHAMLSYELAGHDIQRGHDIEHEFPQGNHGAHWHFRWSREGMRGPAGWADAPQPSTRAAVVLSAVGCSLGGAR